MPLKRHFPRVNLVGDTMNEDEGLESLKTLMKCGFSPPPVSLDIAYQAPSRPIRRVLLQMSGTTDPGYDSLDVIESDHQGTYGLKDVGVHVYINSDGEIQWGRSLERAPEYPREAHNDDIVILLHGRDNTLNMPSLNTLRALLPVINAVHNNELIFSGMTKHHSRLGIGRDGKLIEPALQAPPN